MSIITTKFPKKNLRGFKEVALTNCFRRTFNYGQISKFKRGIIPIKRLNKNSREYSNPLSMYFITTKFHEIPFIEGLTDGRVNTLFPPQLVA